jgi:hypothetical protein
MTMRRLLLATLGVAGCSGAAADGGAGGVAAFGRVQVVSHQTENGATPMFTATPRGDRVISWVSAPDGGADGRLHVAVTPAGSATPLPVAVLADSLGPIQAHGEAPPQVVGDSLGNLHVLYTVGRVVPGRRFPASALRSVRSTDGGRSWEAPVTVNDPGDLGAFGSHSFHSIGLGPDGRLVAAWLDGRTGKTGVYLSRSADGGRSWEPNRAIDADSTCPCCRTAVASGTKGELYVAWRTVLPGDVRDVVVMRSDDGGESWGPKVRPVAHDWKFPGCPHAGPALKVDGEGTLHAAWWTGKEGAAGVYYGRSTDGGRTFEAQPIATGERSRPARVQLALGPAGRVYVTWDDGLGELPRVLLRRSADGGRSFQRTEQISEEGAAATYPVLLVHGDSLSVAWSQTPAAEHHAAAAAKAKADPRAPHALPRVGQSEIFLRTGRL